MEDYLVEVLSVLKMLLKNFNEQGMHIKHQRIGQELQLLMSRLQMHSKRQKVMVTLQTVTLKVLDAI